MVDVDAVGADPKPILGRSDISLPVEGPRVGGAINRIGPAQATPYALPLERFDCAVLFWEEMGGQGDPSGRRRLWTSPRSVASTDGAGTRSR
ncbi:hypothetical protein [Kitasatospora sp. NPDC094011]|uniref:hypothetical protein n=1 Tax=Kitasatospora sp. NPDC094011 TaxID=3364090 RepID=UPI003804B4F9